jgi:protein TonB
MNIFSARKIALSVSSSKLKVLEQVSPAYPRFADMAGVDGYVLLEFTVAPDGSVVTPAVTEASSGHFTQSALNAISRWQFEPVMDNGVAVPVRSNMKFSFVPRSE